MDRKTASAIVLGSLCALTALPAAGAALEARTGSPAVWFAHDTIVDFENLPLSYTCDALWHKLRDVLLALGARPDLKVTPYQCGQSPSVHLQFSLPREVRGWEVQYASVRASPDTLLIKVGRPATLNPSDCELVRQMKDTLLTDLPMHVKSYRFTCDAPPSEIRRYRLTVQTLTPVSAYQAATASAGGLRAPSTASGG